MMDNVKSDSAMRQYQQYGNLYNVQSNPAMPERLERTAEDLDQISMAQHAKAEEQGTSKSSKQLVNGLREYLDKHDKVASSKRMSNTFFVHTATSNQTHAG